MFRWHLKKVLKNKNLSQAELSRRTKIREATVSAFCHGRVKEVRIKDLHAMCKELDCQISEILEYVPRKNN
jgi:putative transcriptional regulator